MLALFVLTSCRTRGEAAQAAPKVLTITSLIQNEYPDAEKSFVEQFTRDTGIQVRIIPTLESVTDRLEQYRRFFDEHAPTPDVVKLDVIWPGIFANELLDLSPYLQSDAGNHFPELVRNMTIHGRLVAMPLSTDVGLLYYRRDLLQEYGYAGPPRTWDELEHMASRIQAGERRKGNSRFWGYVWQGAAYEGLTCNALEWQSEFGRRIIGADGVIRVDSPGAVAALERAAGWVGTISPPSVTDYKEEDTRNIWDAGNAAFMRNWEYDFRFGLDKASLMYGRGALAGLPEGGALGGGALGISRYSRYPREAAAFIRFVTGQATERELWQHAFSLPTLPALYKDPVLTASGEPLALIRDSILPNSFARPSAIAGKYYDQVSRAYFMAVHSVLTHQRSADDALASLAAELAKIPGLHLPAGRTETTTE